MAMSEGIDSAAVSLTAQDHMAGDAGPGGDSSDPPRLHVDGHGAGGGMKGLLGGWCGDDGVACHEEAGDGRLGGAGPWWRWDRSGVGCTGMADRVRHDDRAAGDRRIEAATQASGDHRLPRPMAFDHELRRLLGSGSAHTGLDDRQRPAAEVAHGDPPVRGPQPHGVAQLLAEWPRLECQRHHHGDIDLFESAVHDSVR